MMSLDGYFEGENHNLSWHNVNAEFNEFAIDQLNNASALVFGRKTYELMASYWPSEEAKKDDPVVSCLMTAIPKYVFSQTLSAPGWDNSFPVNKDVRSFASELKEKFEKDIFIFGSAQLSAEFLSEGLIDEFRVMINPVILGRGTLLFRSLPEKISLKLLRSATFANGNVLLLYHPVKEK